MLLFCRGDNVSIGDNLKMYRKKKKITQKQLAASIEKAERTVQKYESGELEPNIDTLNKIAVALNVSISDLLGENISDLNEMDNRDLDIIYGYPELNPLIELFKSRGYKILSENMDIIIEKDNKAIIKIPESDFCDIGKQTLSFINEYIDFQLYKLLEAYEILS